DQVGEVVDDRIADDDDPIAEEARVDVVRALPTAGLLDDDRDEISLHGPWVPPNRMGLYRVYFSRATLSAADSGMTLAAAMSRASARSRVSFVRNAARASGRS